MGRRLVLGAVVGYGPTPTLVGAPLRGVVHEDGAGTAVGPYVGWVEAS